MSRLLVFAVLWAPLVVSSCCHDRLVEHPVVVKSPPCIRHEAPRPPEGAAPCGDRWAAYYRELMAWVIEVEGSCLPPLDLPVASSDLPSRWLPSVGAVPADYP